jgi:hypothetical protein
MAQRKEPLKTNTSSQVNANNGVAFITYDPKVVGAASAASLASKALNHYTGFSAQSSSADSRTRFQNIDPHSSVRSGFDRQTYELFRPNEAVPTDPQGIIAACMQAYKKVGVVRNIIDIMGDFGSQGVRITHPNQRIQKFAQRWFTHKVSGEIVTERFLNYLYRMGTIVVKRRMAKLKISEERRLAIAGTDLLQPTEESDPPLQTGRKNIPSGYNFLNPLSLEMIGGEIGQFVGKQIVALKITASLRMKITSPKNDSERQLIALLPPEILEAVRKGATTIPLDPTKISTFFYKKDDWDTWASPMLESVLDDLILLEKMKLADLAALDGVISQVRIWKLGSLEHGIIPTDAAIQKLADILLSNPGGGAFDVIWGPELEYVDAATKAHEFLGGNKYIPVLDSIHAALGVPPTLTGSSNQPGLTNNFIALQTLVKRLSYGRQIITKFWEQELELLRQAMNWQRAPQIAFDRMILTDEAAEKALLIQLVDRGLISEELLLDRFGEIPELEDLRISREKRERDNDKRPIQVGPYFIPDKMHDLTKTALTGGHINPEDAGLPPRKTADPTPFQQEMQVQKEGLQVKKQQAAKKASTLKGRSGQGRPIGKKDSGSRTRKAKPRLRSSAEISDDVTDFLNTAIWARHAQTAISELVTPALLNHYGKKNMRSLSEEEATEAERIKFRILANLPQYSDINSRVVGQILAGDNHMPDGFDVFYNKLSGQFLERTGKEPNVDESRHIQSVVYSLLSSATNLGEYEDG